VRGMSKPGRPAIDDTALVKTIIERIARGIPLRHALNCVRGMRARDRVRRKVRKVINADA
jgi:hypothetical protein